MVKGVIFRYTGSRKQGLFLHQKRRKLYDRTGICRAAETIPKGKNLTQQELADQLGVSNKSVSRWESGGGYPDVGILAPLAKALGVTVDDLLCDTPPIRKLETADWQNLLSFAFAIGGGVLYFLLDLFMPALVCYLLYLGAMAYGVYLQMRYTYHSRWFQWGNCIMNFFVNVQLLRTAAALLPILSGIQNTILRDMALSGGASAQSLQPLGAAMLGWLAAAALLTALTQYIILRAGTGRLRLESAPMTRRKAIPAPLGALPPLFWGLYRADLGGERLVSAPLPEWMYRYQSPLYWALAAACALVCLLLFMKKGRRGMLIPSLGLVLCSSLCCRFLTGVQLVYSQRSQNIFDAASVNSIFYRPFLSPNAQMLPAAGMLILVYLLLCRVRINLSNITSV